MSPQPKQQHETTEAPATEKYTVRKGDTLMGIVRELQKTGKLTGIGASERHSQHTLHLAAALIVASVNGIADVDRIREGQLLRMPTDKEIGAGLVNLRNGIMSDAVISYSKEVKGVGTDILVGNLASPNMTAGRAVNASRL